MVRGRRVARRAAASALLIGLVAACAGGPAADRAGREQAEPAPPGAEEAEPGSPPSAVPPDASGPDLDPDPTPELPDPDPAPAVGTAEVAEVVARGLDSPWGLAELPNGDLLVGSRDKATIHQVDRNRGETTLLGTVQGVAPGGEGGLLGIAFEGEHVYAYYTTASDNRISRFLLREERAEGSRLSSPDHLVTRIPKGDSHNGGRIAFGPDGLLYAGTGDAGAPDSAQDPESLAGKILRMTPRGRPPEDGNLNSGSLVHSLGHRNVQGLAWDAAERLWATDLGPAASDELNLIQQGGNYGWPDVTGTGGDPEFVDPVHEWDPAEASPSGLAQVSGSLWVAALRGERLWRVPLDGTGTGIVAEPQSFLDEEYGRLRSVLPAGDGELWVLTNNTDGRGHPGEGDDMLIRMSVT
ncbi:PQQ-dependent sugar dehydrogenase [Streptomyces sp. ACA25]|uniref:PQQ-dependent sugar dehydrogenase n=1 Tax=Streptomyces sp. ACA25 TaxID=3022596 RepID=UPI0023080686|nr:PQQ-dependent sugar dehydrogenase [Streptomyces sp. ACA25]MDB1087917.1 PQQ-dependent sugar dehydrogenase [Streptomyces sp. ACA25]